MVKNFKKLFWSYTRFERVGHRADPNFLAVRPQVTVINPMVGGRYFSPNMAGKCGCTKRTWDFLVLLHMEWEIHVAVELE